MFYIEVQNYKLNRDLGNNDFLFKEKTTITNAKVDFTADSQIFKQFLSTN